MKTLLRHPATRVAIVVVSIAAAFALYLFQPWRVFTTVEVHETAPVVAAPLVLSTGSFITHEHATSGGVRVLKLPDGSRVLRIENLDTSDGPDLRVWLSDQPVTKDGWRVFDDGKWLELGELKGNKGSANYVIPASADLSRLTSVSIWCRRFKVSFGAASLSA